MTTSLSRRVGATAALVLAGALAAAPATAVPQDHRVDAATSSDGFAGGTPVSPSTGFATQGVADVCPEGLERGSTVLTEGFEDGLPDGGAFSSGWTTANDEPAVGDAYAYSVRPGGGDLAYMFLEDSYVRPGARTFLSFQVKGNSGDGNMGVVVNDDYWTLYDLEPDTWYPITLDITEVTDYYAEGYLEVQFGHVADPAAGGPPCSRWTTPPSTTASRWRPGCAGTGPAATRAPPTCCRSVVTAP